MLFPEMPASELLRRLGDDDVLVLDCRDGNRGWGMEELQIPGALRISIEELSAWVEALPDDELIVICGVSDDGADARKAWRALVNANLKAVCLQGGLHGWISAGFPTERRAPKQSAAHH